MRAAHKLADEIARAMRFYPMALPTTPPSLLDIDEVYSRVRHLRVLHVAATNHNVQAVIPPGVVLSK